MTKTKSLAVMILSTCLVACGTKSDNNISNKENKDTEVTSKQTSISEICNQYDEIELTEDDFKVIYNDSEVGKDTEADQIIDALGVPVGYEENNLGNISNGNGYRRWALSYPDYNEPEIKYLYLSEQEIDEDGQEIHGQGYIIGVYLMGVGTARDVKVNDTLENVLEEYGRPDNIIEKSEEVEIQYSYEDKTIEIVLDEENIVKSIFIDFNSEKANEEQGV